MREERTVSALQRVFGLAMIVAGISTAAVQLAKGGAPARLGQASLAIAQAAETPRIENAKLETRALSASLDATIREIAATAERAEWVGYHVDQVAGEHGICCNNNWNDGNCGTCRLEKENGGTSNTTHPDGNVKLEGARQIVVLYRIEARQVVKIRAASDDCTLDAGGLTFVWLTGVKATESTALQISATRRSVSVRGATNTSAAVARSHSGSGSASRSIFPFGVTGSSDRITNALGIM